MTKLRMLSLFSGIGGADLGAEMTGGIEVVGQVEIKSYCCQVLSKHWPDVKRINDIREVKGKEFGEIDVIAAGFPCQPFSLSGKRRGKEDIRYLWPEVKRIISEVRPRWFLGENVPGLLSINNGRVFRGILGELTALRYDTAWSVYGVNRIGAPHKRERLFILGYSRSSGLQECNTQPSNIKARFNSRSTSQDEKNWTFESRLGSLCNGLSSRLSSVRWPAPPDKEQASWEPPQTVNEPGYYSSKEIEALGNAIVPYQIYPIFQGIVDQEQRYAEHHQSDYNDQHSYPVVG